MVRPEQFLSPVAMAENNRFIRKMLSLSLTRVKPELPRAQIKRPVVTWLISD
jgi:hypothetical protein